MAAKVIVSRDELLKFGDTSLIGALNRVVGVSVEGTRGQVSDIRLRGLGNGYTQVLLNGEPVLPSFSLESLSPSLVERIEITRSTSIDTGTQAIAGTINIVLRRVLQDEIPGTLKITGSTVNGLPSTMADGTLSWKSDRHAFGITASLARERQSYETALHEDATDSSGSVTVLRNGEGRGREDLGTISLAPTASFQLSGEDRVAFEGLLRYRHIEGDVRERIDTAIGTEPEQARSRFTYDWRSSLATGKVQVINNLFGYAQLDSKISVGSFRRRSDGLLIAQNRSEELAFDRTVVSLQTDRTLGVGSKLKFPERYGHTLAIGIESELARRYEDRVQAERVPPANPRLPQNSSEAYEASRMRSALFVQDEWQTSESLGLTFGARFETVKTESTGTNLQPLTFRSGVLSPVLQMAWKVPGTENDQIRSSISRTYRNPPLADLSPRRYVENNNSPLTPDTEGNPALRSEVAWGADLGYERYGKQGQLLAVNGFYRRIDDAIVKTLFQRDGVWVLRPENLGKARTYGLEFEAKIRADRLLPYATGSLGLTATRNWSRVDALTGTRNRLDGQPAATAGLTYDHKLQGMPLSWAVACRYRSSTYTRLPGDRLTDRSDLTRVDLSATWTNRDLKVNASIGNLTRAASSTRTSYSSTSQSMSLLQQDRGFTEFRISVDFKI